MPLLGLAGMVFFCLSIVVQVINIVYLLTIIFS